MRTNVPRAVSSETTHGGARAATISDELRLRRSVLSCLLWESEFYEDGETIASRIQALVPKIPAVRVEALAAEARSIQHLRHVPLLLERELARIGRMTAAGLAAVIQRADELAEFVALYWKEKRQPLSRQVKRGLALAFRAFDEYSLAKYNRDSTVKLSDVLRLVHPRPADDAQAALWGRLRRDELATPATWEVELSAASGKTRGEKWLTMIDSGKLGGLGTLRNLRNMIEAGVPDARIRSQIAAANYRRVLPFRFIAAARYAPQFEPELEAVMLRSAQDLPKLPGATDLIVDVSGSMDQPLSEKSDLRRVDAACGLAMLAREVCEEIRVFTFSERAVMVAPRRGFALRDVIVHSQPHSNTRLGQALTDIAGHGSSIPRRTIVITDEQSHDAVRAPVSRLGYMINVASDRNGVGYGAWTHVDGWSEACLDFIRETEQLTFND